MNYQCRNVACGKPFTASEYLANWELVCPACGQVGPHPPAVEAESDTTLKPYIKKRLECLHLEVPVSERVEVEALLYGCGWTVTSRGPIRASDPLVLWYVVEREIGE
jgi:hypothetical protein